MLLPKATLRLPFLASFLLSTVIGYTWPSPQYDALEEFLYEGTDKSGVTVATLASGCQTSRLFNGGPTINAEWLRVAYHDMATHNITDGTGGLDASIYYELQRAENVGAGMKNTLGDFQRSSNKYVSRADIIAMGAIWAVTGCSGPPIRFRGGRVDAIGVGRPGVPEPQQDLQSHTESFRLQGFNATEMIALVACGHTMGAVRAVDFPTIVADKKGGDPTVASFDSTVQYDSAVVSEYLSGTTKNPLVVNANTTVLSDLRIFSSDGNVTMKSIESPTAFADTCQNLLERMINTVPSDVQLTDEITLLPFKVKKAELIVNGTDLAFNVVARVAIPGVSNFTQTSSPIPSVQLFWCDRAGPAADCADGQANFAGVSGSLFIGSSSPLTVALNMSFQSYAFSAPISPEKSVGKFWFGVRDAGKGVEDTVLQGNGGAGYLIPQDMVAFVPALSSELPSNTISGKFTEAFGVVVGVKSNSTPTLAEMRVFDSNIAGIAGGSVTIPPPINFTIPLVPLTSVAPVGGYNFYSGNFSDELGQPSVDFAVELDGRRYELDFVQPPTSFAFSPVDGDGVSSVGKTSLTEAMTGGTVNTTVGGAGNGVAVVPGGGSASGGGGGSASSASGWGIETGMWSVIVGVIAGLVELWVL